MADLVPAAQAPPLLDGGGRPVLNRLRDAAAQPAMRRLLPWFGGVAAIGLAALTWSVMSPAPQRMLYSSLSDSERAEVVGVLDAAGIAYQIDNGSGALSVGEDDLYRARMTVAAEGALAAPDTGTAMIDSLPIGASRTLEGDRLRAAQERELQLTIMEIDGVEAVRVHLAQAERSVFVREKTEPTASVMLRLTRGKTITDAQTNAIANLVAASIPGLNVSQVRIVDQHGNLLSDISSEVSDGLELQARIEAKMRSQVSQLLTPMLGEGNFSSEIQVELDMQETTSARESYDKEGAVRNEMTSESRIPGAEQAGGIPGALANTPPADPTAETRPPGDSDTTIAPVGSGGETSTRRVFELGREVAVSNNRPGTVKRVSVAVALNADALAGAKKAELAQIEKLVGAAVGADPQRGDTIAVVTRKFDTSEIEGPSFWETPWFATLVRNAAALLSVLLLLLGVRPLLKLLKPDSQSDPDASNEVFAADEAGNIATRAGHQDSRQPLSPNNQQLAEQVEMARRIAREQPDDALKALRRMLAEQPSDTNPDKVQAI